MQKTKADLAAWKQKCKTAAAAEQPERGETAALAEDIRKKAQQNLSANVIRAIAETITGLWRQRRGSPYGGNA